MSPVGVKSIHLISAQFVTGFTGQHRSTVFHNVAGWNQDR